MLQERWAITARVVYQRDQISASSVVIQYWQLGTSDAMLLAKAECHHAARLVSRSLLAWQLALSIKATKLCLLREVCSYYSDALCARAFQAWLVYYAQCMRQDLALSTAMEQLQQRSLSKIFWGWHTFVRQERGRVLQGMHAAIVFRSTYLQQAIFASWHQWVRLLQSYLDISSALSSSTLV